MMMARVQAIGRPNWLISTVDSRSNGPTGFKGHIQIALTDSYHCQQKKVIEIKRPTLITDEFFQKIAFSGGNSNLIYTYALL